MHCLRLLLWTQTLCVDAKHCTPRTPPDPDSSQHTPDKLKVDSRQGSEPFRLVIQCVKEAPQSLQNQHLQPDLLLKEQNTARNAEQAKLRGKQQAGSESLNIA